MTNYKVHFADGHYNETACGRLLYTYYGRGLQRTRNKDEVTCTICRRKIQD